MVETVIREGDGVKKQEQCLSCEQQSEFESPTMTITTRQAFPAKIGSDSDHQLHLTPSSSSSFHDFTHYSPSFPVFASLPPPLHSPPAFPSSSSIPLPSLTQKSGAESSPSTSFSSLSSGFLSPSLESSYPTLLSSKDPTFRLFTPSPSNDLERPELYGQNPNPSTALHHICRICHGPMNDDSPFLPSLSYDNALAANVEDPKSVEESTKSEKSMELANETVVTLPYGIGNPSVTVAQSCKCTGSIGFMHQACLQQWVNVRRSIRCEICKAPFKGVEPPPLLSSLPLPFRIPEGLLNLYRLDSGSESRSSEDEGAAWSGVYNSHTSSTDIYAVNGHDMNSLRDNRSSNEDCINNDIYSDRTNQPPPSPPLLPSSSSSSSSSSQTSISPWDTDQLPSDYQRRYGHLRRRRKRGKRRGRAQERERRILGSFHLPRLDSECEGGGPEASNLVNVPSTQDNHGMVNLDPSRHDPCPPSSLSSAAPKQQGSRGVVGGSEGSGNRGGCGRRDSGWSLIGNFLRYAMQRGNDEFLDDDDDRERSQSANGIPGGLDCERRPMDELIASNPDPGSQGSCSLDSGLSENGIHRSIKDGSGRIRDQHERGDDVSNINVVDENITTDIVNVASSITNATTAMTNATTITGTCGGFESSTDESRPSCHTRPMSERRLGKLRLRTTRRTRSAMSPTIAPPPLPPSSSSFLLRTCDDFLDPSPRVPKPLGRPSPPNGSWRTRDGYGTSDVASKAVPVTPSPTSLPNCRGGVVRRAATGSTGSGGFGGWLGLWKSRSVSGSRSRDARGVARRGDEWVRDEWMGEERVGNEPDSKFLMHATFPLPSSLSSSRPPPRSSQRQMPSDVLIHRTPSRDGSPIAPHAVSSQDTPCRLGRIHSGLDLLSRAIGNRRRTSKGATVSRNASTGWQGEGRATGLGLLEKGLEGESEGRDRDVGDKKDEEEVENEEEKEEKEEEVNEGGRGGGKRVLGSGV